MAERKGGNMTAVPPGFTAIDCPVKTHCVPYLWIHGMSNLIQQSTFSSYLSSEVSLIASAEFCIPDNSEKLAAGFPSLQVLYAWTVVACANIPNEAVIQIPPTSYGIFILFRNTNLSFDLAFPPYSANLQFLWCNSHTEQPYKTTKYSDLQVYETFLPEQRFSTQQTLVTGQACCGLQIWSSSSLDSVRTIRSADTHNANLFYWSTRRWWWWRW